MDFSNIPELVRQGRADAIFELLPTLTDDQRMRVVQKLAKCADATMVSQLAEIAKGDPEKMCRLDAVKALGSIGTEESETAIVSATRFEGSNYVLRQAIRQIGKTHHQTSLTRLGQLAMNDNPRIRECAVDAVIAKPFGSESEKILMGRIDDPLFRIRFKSISGLRAEGSAVAVAAVKEHLARESLLSRLVLAFAR